MEKRIMKQNKIEISLLGDTVIINNAEFIFSYTPANSVCKPEFKDQYKYFGGIQHNLQDGSMEAEQLEKKLATIAENVLEIITLTTHNHATNI